MTRHGVVPRDEVVDEDVLVLTFDEMEGDAADGRCGHESGLIAVVAEGTDAVLDAEPDHDFVGFGAGGQVERKVL